MEKYEKHFLLDTETVKDYVKEKLHFFKKDAILMSEEIGDGNINYVFRVWNPKGRKSIVIKQADVYLRSSGRPLDMHRNKIEAEILKIEGALAPGYVPQIYYYDEKMYALSMEDISAYKNLRKELIDEKTFPHFAENIASFLVDTLLPTTDLVMDRAKKKERVKLFTNPELCDISEDLVFTEPYYNYKNRNIILEENLEFVKQYLYEDQELHIEVGRLRDDFMNHAQALIHGDLHSGSIFINEDGIKVIDPEFAFYGPIGYDIGNVIGNLYFAWANKLYTNPGNTTFLAWVKEAIQEITDQFLVKFRRKYKELVIFPFYRTEGFRDFYLKQVLADSFGYAGTEIIRRVVGDSKVIEITGVTNHRERVLIERGLIRTGIRLIKEREQIDSGEIAVKIGTEELCYGETR